MPRKSKPCRVDSEFYRGRASAFNELSEVLRKEAIQHWENDSDETAELLKCFSKEASRMASQATKDQQVWIETENKLKRKPK